MSTQDVIAKSRYIWDVRAWQLLREKAASQYALKVVPRQVRGIRIEFPQVEISLGIQIRVTSCRVQGQSLLAMIYSPQVRDSALDMALIALEALYRADVTSDPFPLFGLAYRLLRSRELLLSEMIRRPILSREQRVALHRLMSDDAKARNSRKRVLMHGDLHPGNVVVNLARKSLGLVDLEMLHVGRPTMDFAQLWIGFRLADPQFAQRLYMRYTEQFPEMLSEQFDSGVQVELALRCYWMIRAGRKSGNTRMEKEACRLLQDVLEAGSFEELCFGGTTK